MSCCGLVAGFTLLCPQTVHLEEEEEEQGERGKDGGEGGEGERERASSRGKGDLSISSTLDNRI